MFLTCRCRIQEFTDVLPGELVICPNGHGEQKVISAKQIGARHNFVAEPGTGWSVCSNCGDRHPGTHFGRRLRYEGVLECGCSRSGELFEKFFAQHGVWCQEHKTRAWRDVETTVIDDEACHCGRCMDERTARTRG